MENYVKFSGFSRPYGLPNDFIIRWMKFVWYNRAHISHMEIFPMHLAFVLKLYGTGKWYQCFLPSYVWCFGFCWTVHFSICCFWSVQSIRKNSARPQYLLTPPHTKMHQHIFCVFRQFCSNSEMILLCENGT